MFLACDNWKKDDPSSCRHAVWPKAEVDELPGHGKDCTKCGKGKMQTRTVGKGEHKGKRFLSCNRYPECQHSEWPDRGQPRGDGGKGAAPARKGGLSGLGRRRG
jgi:DNA topoisomerase-3